MRVAFVCLVMAAVVAVVGCGKGDRKGGGDGAGDNAPGGGPRPGVGAGPAPAAMEGTYKIVRIAANGIWNAPGSDDAEAVIKGDKLTLRGGPFGRDPGAVYTIKVSALQSTIEMESTGRPGEKFTDRGIYKAEKDQLLIAVVRKGDAPKDFEPRPGVAIYDLKKK